MKKIKLSYFLIAVISTLAVIPLVLSIFISNFLASKAMTEQRYSQLASVREIKAAAIERHFSQSLSTVKTISKSPTTLNASRRFKSALNRYFTETNRTQAVPNLRNELSGYYDNEFAKRYREINNETVDAQSLYGNISDIAVALQHDYIFANPAELGAKDSLFKANNGASYHDVHEQFHGYFRQILQEFGYYDIFLVDPESGVVFYSVFKELDYATSLLSGPYANTNFAKVFRKTVADKGLHTIDYERYRPSYEAPASFQAAPVLSGDKLEAVLVFQLPIEPINSIMASREGLGETGETYLVGEDRLMRSDSYLQPDTHSVKASFANPKKGKVDTSAVDSAFSGNTGTDIVIDYLGNPVLSSWQPISMGDFRWAILAEIDKNEAFSAINELRTINISVIVVGVIIIVIVGFWVSQIISRPILSMSRVMEKVQKTNDFSIRINSDYQNEIGEIARSFDHLLGSLKEAFTSSQNDRDEALKQRKLANEEAENARLQKQQAEEQRVIAQQKAEEAAQQQKLALQSKEQAELKTKEAQSASQQAQQKAQEALEATQEAERQKQIADNKAQEAERIAEQAHKAAIEANRIKQALDNVSTNAIVCDAAQKIIYLNHSMLSKLETLTPGIRKTNREFDADNLIGAWIGEILGSDAGLLQSTSNQQTPEIRIANAIFEISVNDILAEDQKKLGTVIELRDRTMAINAQKEVDNLVACAASGDLSARVSEDNKTGFYLSLANGLNKLVGISERIIFDAGKCLELMAQGDL